MALSTGQYELIARRFRVIGEPMRIRLLSHPRARRA